MRALTRRERWLLIPLPAVLLGAFHWVSLRPPVELRIAAAQARIAGRPVQSAADLRAEIDQDRASLDRLATAGGELLETLSERLAAWTKPTDRAAVVRRISAALVEDSARLLSSAPVAKTADAPSLSPRLRTLVSRMQQLGGATPELWRFSLRGTFSELVGAFSSLARVDGFVLPVTFSMHSATADEGAPAPGDPELLELTLWTWI